MTYNINIILISFIINFSLFKKVNLYFVLSFKGNNLSEILANNQEDFQSNIEKFFMSTFFNQIYTAMGMGSPTQYIVIKINPSQMNFFFDKRNCDFFYNNEYINKDKITPNNATIHINVSKIGYNLNESTTFKLIPSKNKYYFGNESLTLDNYQNILTKNDNRSKIFPYCQNHIFNFSFTFEISSFEEENEICGSLGLSLGYDANGNKFFEQLKKLNFTQNYYWSFNYSSLDKGNIIIGILPHEYNFSENFNESNLIQIYTNEVEGDLNWGMDLNDIYFNIKDKKIKVGGEIDEGNFDFANQLIIGSATYREEIIKYFFQELFDKNICKEEIYSLNINYSMIICDNNFKDKIINFPNLHLYNRFFKTEFELNYNDLFITVNNYYYFFVIFRRGKITETNKTWILGIPFLKKFNFVMDSDKKTIGYYVTNQINQKDDDNKNNKDDYSKGNSDWNFFGDGISWRTIIEIIVGLFLIGIAVFFSVKLYCNKRKKKPYELQDDDYDYFSSKQDNNNDKAIND